jgi:transcriptional regulator with XRE-family HTH domain
MRWDNDAFRERLAIAKGQDSTNAFAQKSGISESVFRKYLAGVTVPGADKLVDIARVSGVSLVWLATGRGPVREEESTSGEATEAVDLELLETVIEAVEEGLLQIGATLAPAKKAKLVATIYRIYQSGGEAGKGTVLELVRLAV